MNFPRDGMMEKNSSWKFSATASTGFKRWTLEVRFGETVSRSWRCWPGDCHELSYSPLNNVYTDSKVFETVEAMLTDPKVDANRFRQIGRYQ
ncbi:MAG: hypothetical protein ACLR23_04025 [Clostridia bacterium]